MRVSALGVFIAVVIGLILLVSLAGCGGQVSRVQDTGANNPPAAGPAALPLPQTLAGKRQTAAAVLYLKGGAFDTALVQRVIATGDNAGFAPVDDGSTPLPQAMAYALYRFDVSGATGAQTLSLVWSGTPPGAGNGWIGLGDWGKNRWDWLPLPATGEIALDAARFAAYTKPGTSELICLVGITGSQSCTLQGLGFELPPPPAAQWPMFGHDPQHTFRSDAIGSQTGQLKWTFRTTGRGNEILEPAVAPDGTIYACDSTYLTAYDPDGNVLWRFLHACDSCGTPVVCPDGTILLSAGGGLSGDITVHALYPDGTLKCEYPDISVVAGVGADNTIYGFPSASDATDGIIALNPDGTKRWGTPYSGSLEVAADGTVYICDSAGLHALDADGALLWSIAEPKSCSLVIGPDGVVYCYTYGHVYSVSATGVLNWEYIHPKSDCRTARPAFGPGGMVYVAFFSFDTLDPTAALCALTSTGELSWSYEAEHGFNAVVVAKSGNVVALSHLNDLSFPCSLMCFDNSGNLNWTYADFAAADQRNSLTALPDGGVLASASYFGALHAVNADGSQRWVRGAGGSVQWNPVIGQDGAVYIGCNDGTLYAVAPDGALQWKFEHPTTLMQCPVVVNDTVYDTYGYSIPSYLYAFELDGTLKWSLTQDKEGCKLGPVAGPQGEIYWCSSEDLSAVGANGVQQWSFSTEDSHDWFNCPAVAPDGTIYASTYNNLRSSTLRAISPLGAQQWVYTTGYASAAYSPAVGADGTLYMCAGGALYAVNPDGSLKWTYHSTTATVGYSPALAADGTIYVPGEPGVLSAVNPDGTSKWVFATQGDRCGTPAVDAAGNVYFSSTDKNIYCVDADGQLKWQYSADAASSIPVSPAIAADGTVYVGAGNLLYAFGD
jgi:outer membrane protein assembly factor BamB